MLLPYDRWLDIPISCRLSLNNHSFFPCFCSFFKKKNKSAMFWNLTPIFSSSVLVLISFRCKTSLNLAVPIWRKFGWNLADIFCLCRGMRLEDSGNDSFLTDILCACACPEHRYTKTRPAMESMPVDFSFQSTCEGGRRAGYKLMDQWKYTEFSYYFCCFSLLIISS